MICTPANAGCEASIPVSSTATTIPSPSNADVSAPTAWTPHAIWSAAAATMFDTSRGAMSFMGIDGATARTSA